MTGAEFASAYDALGCDVVLVSSRDRVLPGEDADAAQVLEDVFTRRGMTVLSRSRARSVVRAGGDVLVTLTDGREVRGSHCLLAVGSVPNTEDLGLETVRLELAAGRLPQCGPGLADLRARHLRRRRLYRGAAPGLGRGHAGPDRDVARPR